MPLGIGSCCASVMESGPLSCGSVVPYNGGVQVARAVTRKPRRTKLVEKAAIPRSPATNCYAALSLGRGDPRRRSLPDAQPKKLPTQTATDKSVTIPAKEHTLPGLSHPLPTPKTET